MGLVYDTASAQVIQVVKMDIYIYIYIYIISCEHAFN